MNYLPRLKKFQNLPVNNPFTYHYKHDIRKRMPKHDSEHYATWALLRGTERVGEDGRRGFRTVRRRGRRWSTPSRPLDHCFPASLALSAGPGYGF